MPAVAVPLSIRSSMPLMSSCGIVALAGVEHTGRRAGDHEIASRQRRRNPARHHVGVDVQAPRRPLVDPEAGDHRNVLRSEQ